MTPSDLLRFCEAELAWQLAALRELVRLESPSDQPDALLACARGLARLAASLGAAVTGVDDRVAGEPLHVRASIGHGRPRVLLLGHLDTVWPIGTLPIEERDGRLYGPGVYDMKGGLVIALQALRALQAHGGPAGALTLLCTTDEEVGSDASRPLIEREAQASDVVLVLEPALANGGVKTGRKGVGDFRVEIEGVAAHAGIEPALGASAIHELTRQAALVLGLARPELGTTVNIGVIAGGSRSNVVAERAAMAVDVRVTSMAEAARVDAAMRALAATDPRVTVTVHGGVDRPPMERTEAIVRLYEKARAVAAEIGDDLAEGQTGGASDGNFTAALGVPTLDGLGAIGEGAHARHEHVRLGALPRRTALVAGLAARLLADGSTVRAGTGLAARGTIHAIESRHRFQAGENVDR